MIEFKTKIVFDPPHVTKKHHAQSSWKYTVMCVTDDDMHLYYEWASDKLVRDYSYNSEAIDLQKHEKWFKQKLLDPECLMLVFYNDLAEKIGLAIGTFSFGLIEGFLNIRSSILALIVFFVLGLLLLLRVPKSEKLSAIK